MSSHGTKRRYNEGCRCEGCQEANRELGRRTTQQLHARPAEDVPHGTAGGYRNWGCRCTPCAEANAAGCKAYRQRRRRDDDV